jgi:hypothetical protein
VAGPLAEAAAGCDFSDDIDSAWVASVREDKRSSGTDGRAGAGRLGCRPSGVVAVAAAAATAAAGGRVSTSKAPPPSSSSADGM